MPKDPNIVCESPLSLREDRQSREERILGGMLACLLHSNSSSQQGVAFEGHKELVACCLFLAEKLIVSGGLGTLMITKNKN